MRAAALAVVAFAAIGTVACSTGGDCAPIPCPAPGFDPETCACRPPPDGGPTDVDAAPMDGGGAPVDAAPPATVDVSQTLSDPALAGTGSCTGFTLGDVVARVRADNPALADITDFVGPYASDRERLIFAFAIPNGFRVVFKRGSGDCPAGCISNAYWYYETDAACVPQPAGHYSAQYQSPGNCFVIEGAPVWGFPNPRAPACPP